MRRGNIMMNRRNNMINREEYHEEENHNEHEGNIVIAFSLDMGLESWID
jgi:hypothetical protein